MTSGATFSNPIVVDDSDDETVSMNDNVTVDYNDRPVPPSMIDWKARDKRPATAPSSSSSSSVPSLTLASVLGASLMALGITRSRGEGASDGKRSSSEPKTLPSHSSPGATADSAVAAVAPSELPPLYGYEQDGGPNSARSSDSQTTVRQQSCSPPGLPLVARTRSESRDVVNSSPTAADDILNGDDDDDATQPLPLTLSLVCRCGESLSDCRCAVDIRSPPIPPSPASVDGGDLVNEFQTNASSSDCHKCGESLVGAQHPFCEDD